VVAVARTDCFSGSRTIFKDVQKVRLVCLSGRTTP
jgi:hypothetical protein